MDTLRKTFHWVEKLQIPPGNSGSNEKTKGKIVRKKMTEMVKWALLTKRVSNDSPSLQFETILNFLFK